MMAISFGRVRDGLVSKGLYEEGYIFFVGFIDGTLIHWYRKNILGQILYTEYLIYMIYVKVKVITCG